MSLPEKDTTKKGRVDKNWMELDAGNNSGDYKVEAIWNSAVHVGESVSGYLPGFYYLVLWKKDLEEEITWKPALALQHFWKRLNKFHYDNPDKPTTTSSSVDTALSMAKPIILLPAKRK